MARVARLLTLTQEGYLESRMNRACGDPVASVARLLTLTQVSRIDRRWTWTDSGRGLRNDQSDCSLPHGRELNLDFTGR